MDSSIRLSRYNPRHYRSSDTKSKSTYTYGSWVKKHQFKLLVAGSVVAIILCWWVKDPQEQGSFSSDPISHDLLPLITGPSFSKKRSYPRESVGEQECRRVLENLFKRPFPSRRPLFLMNNVTGKPLEIDCCNDEMRLGVEYNGEQHYKYTPGMHSNHDAFRNQQYRDEMKKRMCADHQFDLIVVPYTIPTRDIESFIIHELKRLRRI